MDNLQVDKKQLPIVVLLGVLAIGIPVYFTMRMLNPAPTNAASNTQVSSKLLARAAASSTSDAPPLLSTQAPMGGQRDPFVEPVEAVDAPTASGAPATPTLETRALGEGSKLGSLPALGSVSPLPPMVGGAAASSLWTLKGVITPASHSTATTGVAIFRLGAVGPGRYVRTGQLLDSGWRVASITRGAVKISQKGKTLRVAVGTSAPIAVDPALLPPPTQVASTSPMQNPAGAGAPSGPALPSTDPAARPTDTIPQIPASALASFR